MENLYRLVEVLADGRFHSGEELGKAMGITRAAVWKQLQKLEDMGISASKVKGRGYRLDNALDLLSSQAIETLLSPSSRALLSTLEVHQCVDSTNSLVAERLRDGVFDGASALAVLAEQQTQGRGRRGRTWVSPYGRNIYLSLAWRFGGGSTALSGLSLAVGLALIQALGDLGIVGLSLKWPNDVLIEGRKLAGVLLEMSGDPAGQCDVVIGIGVNVAMSQSAHAEQIDQQWIDLQALAGVELSRNALVAALLNRLLPMLKTYEQDGFAHYRAEWEAHSGFLGQPVQITSGDGVVEGVDKGVDELGALILEVSGELRKFHGGEVSLRPIAVVGQGAAD